MVPSEKRGGPMTPAEDFQITYFDTFDGCTRTVTVCANTEADALKYARDVYGATERNIREVRRCPENGDWD